MENEKLTEIKFNYCLNKKISLDEKKMLLKIVLDDITFNALKPKDINEAFEINLANILISTRGEF